MTRLRQTLGLSVALFSLLWAGLAAVGDEAGSCDVEPGFAIQSYAPPILGTIPADVDGDGDVDLVGSGWNENDGNGNFGVWTDLGGGTFSPHVVADLDGDGKFDLVGVASVADGTALAWRRQLGGVARFGPVRVLFGGYEGLTLRDPFGAIDLDLDGDVDLLLGSRQLNTDERDLLLFENLGGATFTLRSVADVETGTGALSSGTETLADLNGDGIPDLVGRLDDDAVWFPATGGGSFLGEAASISLALPGSNVRIRPADLEGDGDTDIVFGNITPLDDVEWSENLDGAGTFAARSPLVQYPLEMRDVAPVDWDGDGDADLMAQQNEEGGSCPSNWCMRLDFSENLGAGAFAPPAVAHDFGESELLFPDAVAAFRPDGEIEVAFVRWLYFGEDAFFTTLVVMENRTDDCNGNGVLDSCELTPADDCNGNGVLDDCELAVPSRDCDGSGVLDSCEIASGGLADCTGNGVADVCEPDCNGNGVADSCDVDAGTSPDVDSDGTPDGCQEDCNGNSVPDTFDIEIGTSGDCDTDATPDECEPDCDANGVPDACQIVLGFTEHPVATAPGSSIEQLLIVDLDGDGDGDVVSRDDAEVLAWYENLDGAGTFAAAVQVTTETVRDVVVSDVDDNGTLDLVAATLTGVRRFEHSPVGFVETLVDGGFTPDIAAGDLDADGDDDLGVKFVSGISWLKNTGGGFEPARFVDAGFGFVSIDAADLDLDGRDELLVVSTAGLFWHDLTGGAGWTAHEIGDAPDGAKKVEAVDLDADGDLDLVAGSIFDSLAFRLENVDAPGTFALREMMGKPWEGTFATADFDGDGRPEVAGARVPAEFILIRNLLDGTFFPEVVVATAAAEGRAAATGDVDGDGEPDLVMAFDDPGSIAWFENGRDDCNANGVPDACEADCDGNGRPDDCDLTSGAAVDCNGNGVPDPCDAGCSGCDTDGDGCLDAMDDEPLQTGSCGDTDGDGCDDCAAGTFDPANDGIDRDGDGFCAVSDCDDMFAGAWREPSSVALTLSQIVAPTLLAWDAPADPGATAPRFDTLRSGDPTDFFGAVCLESDGTDRVSDDSGLPATGQAFFYLIRVENGCPGAGAMGQDSTGVPRNGVDCP